MIHSLQEWNDVGFGIEVLSIAENSCNELHFTIMSVINYHNLRSFVVGDNSCKFVRSLCFSNLPQLERIEIGNNCFVVDKGVKCFGIDEEFFMSESKDLVNGSFVAGSCPKLREIHCGSMSFAMYESCSLEGKVITVVMIGTSSFKNHSVWLSHSGLERLLKELPVCGFLY